MKLTDLVFSQKLMPDGLDIWPVLTLKELLAGLNAFLKDAVEPSGDSAKAE